MFPKRALSVALAVGVGALWCLGAVLVAAPFNESEQTLSYASAPENAKFWSLLSDPKKLNSFLKSLTEEEVQENYTLLNALLAWHSACLDSNLDGTTESNTDKQPFDCPEFDEWFNFKLYYDDSMQSDGE